MIPQGLQPAPTVDGAQGFKYVQSMGYEYLAAFERRVDVCGGAWVVKGTRVPVRTLLGSLAEGSSESELLAEFPTVTAEALRAVIAFAAASATEDLPLAPLPTVAA